MDKYSISYKYLGKIDGRIFFTIPLQEQQYVHNGSVIGYISPFNNHFYLESELSQDNLGKIDTGMTVQLRFYSYPYLKVGFVKGTLDYISKVASDSGFRATIRLDNGLITNNRIFIPYRSGLKADAVIIAKNQSLFERLYYNVLNSISTRK